MLVTTFCRWGSKVRKHKWLLQSQTTVRKKLPSCGPDLSPEAVSLPTPWWIHLLQAVQPMVPAGRCHSPIPRSNQGEYLHSALNMTVPHLIVSNNTWQQFWDNDRTDHWDLKSKWLYMLDNADILKSMYINIKIYNMSCKPTAKWDTHVFFLTC